MAIGAAIATMVSTCVIADANVKVLDNTHYPADNFLAYTEFELSGEPLAEALGLDLNLLDPSLVNQPTAFDYAAGIESYEYSEEAMYALNYQSQMGPHLANGPTNSKRNGTLAALGQRFVELANAVGFPADEIPLNMYPISLPYVSGSPILAGKVDTTPVNGDKLYMIDATGKEKTVETVIPAYFRDYKSLKWKAESFNKTINPAALGGILLKEVMWSQDFLGGMHETESDNEVEALSSTQDHNEKYSLGVSAADGFNGLILTEMSLDKMLILQEQLGFDGKKLGAKITPAYNAIKEPIWFPHAISVNEKNTNDLKDIATMLVTDSQSTLRDTWQLLWPLSECFAFTDQRTQNTGQNPAFLAVFDGAPFAAAPVKNIDAKTSNDVKADDIFSVTSNLSNMIFQNLDTLHFNSKAGTFVTIYDANTKQNNQVNTFDAAYSLVALSIYQRAQDALPVGYASAEGGDVNLKTAQGKRALALINAQATYITKQLIGKNGLVYDGNTIGKEAHGAQSLETQFATIRGLIAASLATGNTDYMNSARSLYLTVDAKLYDNDISTWANEPGKATIHTPLTAAAISGGLREVILHLANKDGASEPALELSKLTQRYTSWFRTVINGGMQLAEWVGDSGENMIKGSNTIDSDADGVKSVAGAGVAMTMAAKVSVSAK